MVADEVIAIFAENGGSAYYGEAVTQLEHALQAAQCAERDGAGEALIVAALVHDIGHLVAGEYDQQHDARHEEVGRRWLEAKFGKAVSEPAHLHVAAKRYLCAAEPGYFGKLSPASVESLALQGGPMSPSEVKDFEANQFYREAVQLRQWDDEAKIPGLPTRQLEAYRPLLNAKARV